MTIPPKPTGIIRIVKALSYSWDGLQAAFKDEAAFRQEVALTIILSIAAIYLAPDKISLTLMIGSLFIVLMAELLNTAIEANVDLHSMDRHPLAKKAKDAGSAAVLLALILVTIIWIIILI